MVYFTSLLTGLEALLGLALISASIYTLSRAGGFREVKSVALGRMFNVKSVRGALVLGGAGTLLFGFALLAIRYIR